MRKKVSTLKIRSIGYSFKQGFKNIGRNRMFTIASIATMTACIFLFAVFFAVIINVRSLVTSVEEEVGITVLFDEGIKDDKIVYVPMARAVKINRPIDKELINVLGILSI